MAAVVHAGSIGYRATACLRGHLLILLGKIFAIIK